MNNRLEEFVRDHREEFDSEEPDNAIWDRISRDIEPDKKKPAPVVPIRTNWIKYSAAAVLIILIGGGALMYLRSNKGSQPNVAATTPQTTPVDTQTQAQTQDPAPLAQTPTQDSASQNLASTRPGEKKPTELESNMNDEMYHYARIVEIKHKELKAIQKDEPLLYQQFSADVSKLDSVFHNLQEQLPKNPNREQLLEAMLQNLQLQMELLNHQLEIVKKINQSKKTEYEKAYKTI